MFQLEKLKNMQGRHSKPKFSRKQSIYKHFIEFLPRMEEGRKDDISPKLPNFFFEKKIEITPSCFNFFSLSNLFEKLTIITFSCMYYNHYPFRTYSSKVFIRLVWSCHVPLHCVYSYINIFHCWMHKKLCTIIL